MFALAAALLVAIGTYGVISYIVWIRTREIGIRVALGARPGDVGRRMLGFAARLAFIGVAFGVAATYALSRYLGSLLFGVPPTDPTVIGTSVVTMTGVALAAAYAPARRAARIDPAMTLRAE